MLLRCGKPVVLAVNKVDSPGTDPDSMSSTTWGWATPSPSPPSTATAPATCWTPACSISRRRTRRKRRRRHQGGGHRQAQRRQVLPGQQDPGGGAGHRLQRGRHHPGRHRLPFENDKGKFVFIDTAGMRKKSKVEEDMEKYSVLRATMAIERGDVCLIMIDATEGVTEQDTKVAGLAHEAGKASIIVVNKWDLVEKDGKTMDQMRQDVRRDLAYMTYAPILFISAKTGQRVDRLFELIDYVSNQASIRITTGMLNNVLADAQTRVQPPTDKGRRLKIYYMTQVGVRPPHFVVFCNDAGCSISPISGIWKTASAIPSAWRERPSSSPSGRRATRRSETWPDLIFCMATLFWACWLR